MEKQPVTIYYSKLKQKDDKEILALKQAFETWGFAYLDLTDQKDDSGSLLCNMEKAFYVAKQFFSLDKQEKVKFDIDKIGPYKLNGYKPIGRNAGVSKETRDGFEAYLLPRNGLCTPPHDATALDMPSPMLQHAESLKELLNSLHTIGLEILGCLRRPDNDEHLVNRHRPSETSTSAFAFLKYPLLSAECGELGQYAHTDVGSLTILFFSERGLQVLNPTGTEWQYLDPKEGCALLNVGDCLRFLSNGLYRSSLHRVVPFPGVAIQDRYSCAYFMRPELDVEFVDDDGNKWNSLDWHINKYHVFRASVDEQAKSSVLTGRPGVLGLWEG
ncbi:2OG-Fe(II) oxygenase family oxidoreductase [Xylariaceae sp. FL1651]|nr:2OG-Fe(II) oxygenase family oxidoreductase [Xylariaceae sp. FL1651]